MSEILLRGHHVKNLRQALNENSYGSFRYLIDEPQAQVRIVAGQMDIMCDNCDKLSECLGEEKITEIQSKIYDKMLAYASGVLVGNIYQSKELVEMIEKQNSIKYFLKEFGMVLLYLPVCLTVGPYEEFYLNRFRHLFNKSD